ncbi:MAG: class I SAM-dependent methyltransferase [Myxococcales bacterium]|nr:class I SAM-dependent methyltransferase [Myxococcales bacterium]
MRSWVACAAVVGLLSSGCGAQQTVPPPQPTHDKPAAPVAKGESRPPPGHSEHREQMKEYGSQPAATAKSSAAGECPHAHKGHKHRKKHTECPHAHKHHGHGGHGHGGHGKGYKVHSAHHRFNDAARWAKVFESKKRDAWQKGDVVVDSLKLKRDARVADIGAGTGYFTMRFAKRLRMGIVYAVDIEQSMVDWVVKRARRVRQENVVGVLATARSPKLPGPVDVIFVSNTYHHITERRNYFARLQRKLNKDGRVVIVDFKMGKLPVGPPDAHKIAPKRIVTEMKLAGYKLVRRDDTTLPYQHLLVFASSL